MKQWLLGAAAIMLLTIILGWPKGGDSAEASDVAKSERVLLDRDFRVGPEREMSIGEMEKSVGSLRDDELWTEIQASCEQWMEVNGAREYKIPPRFVVILAREVGRRQGEAGIWNVANFLKEKEERWDFDEAVRERAQALNYLRDNLNYATFGGWASVQADEAICWLIKLREEDELDDPPFLAVNPQVLDSFPLPAFWAYERVVREAFGRLASQDVDRAMELLKEGGIEGVFDVNFAIEAVVQRLSHIEKQKMMREVADDSDWLNLVNIEVWADDVVKRVVELDEAELRSWQNLKLFEVLARARSSKAAEILAHPEASAELRETMGTWLGLFDPQHLYLMSKQEIPLFINDLISMSDGYRFGPVDGRDSGWIPDWDEHHKVLAEVVEESDLEAGDKRKYLGMIEESRGRLAE